MLIRNGTERLLGASGRMWVSESSGLSIFFLVENGVTLCVWFHSSAVVPPLFRVSGDGPRSWKWEVDSNGNYHTRLRYFSLSTSFNLNRQLGSFMV